MNQAFKCKRAANIPRIIYDLPIISSNTFQNIQANQSPPGKNKKTNRIQITSPKQIKSLIKNLKNSNSNKNLIKVTPYCNNILKTKLINDLKSIKKQKQICNTYLKKKAFITNRLNLNCTQNNGQIKLSKHNNINKIYLGQSFEKFQQKAIGQGKYLIVCIFNQQLHFQINKQICQGQILSVKKISQAVNKRLQGHRLYFKSKAIVGYTVSNLKPNIQQSSKNSLLQCCSYLLSIGKLSLFDQIFQPYKTVILIPIFPKRLKYFMNKKILSDQNHIENISLLDFDIIKCLGSGGFSTVFLVQGNFNGKYYAMKLIDKQFILDTDRDGIVQNQRFILEKLSNIKDIKNSPIFVTQLYFCFQTANYFVFMLEYCPGGQLFNQLKKVKRMTQDQAKFYFLEILISLNYIHSHNILYRDLKPQNLLIDADGHIKIADFGLSKPLDNYKLHSYSFCGSPQYMAPQMLTKTGHNYLLDYYCLGALLYELVIGVPPYYSRKQQQIYESILTQQLTFPNHIPLSNQIKNLLCGLLKKDTKQRLGYLYGSKQIMFHPWIGRINSLTIQNRQLISPFVSNLTQDNFDSEQIKVNIVQIMQKLNQDAKNQEFQTHFCNEFMFIHPKQKLQFLNNCQFTQAKRNRSINLTCRKTYLTKSSSIPSQNRFTSPTSNRSQFLMQRNRKSLKKKINIQHSIKKSHTIQNNSKIKQQPILKSRKNLIFVRQTIKQQNKENYLQVQI